jgi:hypothetical protein
MLGKQGGSIGLVRGSLGRSRSYHRVGPSGEATIFTARRVTPSGEGAHDPQQKPCSLRTPLARVEREVEQDG